MIVTGDFQIFWKPCSHYHDSSHDCNRDVKRSAVVSHRSLSHQLFSWIITVVAVVEIFWTSSKTHYDQHDRIVNRVDRIGSYRIATKRKESLLRYPGNRGGFLVAHSWLSATLGCERLRFVALNYLVLSRSVTMSNDILRWATSENASFWGLLRAITTAYWEVVATSAPFNDRLRCDAW